MPSSKVVYFLKLTLSPNVSTILVHESTCRERERGREGGGHLCSQALSAFQRFTQLWREGEGGPGEEASYIAGCQERLLA